MIASLRRRSILSLILGALLLAPSASASANDNFIIVQSTTSTQNSGLFNHILPMFREKTGIEVRIVAVGTGQALKNAKNGDGDVVLVHSKSDEEKFVAEGWGVERHDVMYNDFVIVGPASDPAEIAGLKEADRAFKRIAEVKAPFASRGDDSGTNKEEKRIWNVAGVDAKKASGDWYLETGSGMGATLNMAVGKRAYTLADRGTWLSFANKDDFKVFVERDPKLFNQYGVILVNPAKHPNVKAKQGQMFVDWLIGKDGQTAIARYKIGGKQLFFPNAHPAPNPSGGALAKNPRGRLSAPWVDSHPLRPQIFFSGDQILLQKTRLDQMGLQPIEATSNLLLHVWFEQKGFRKNWWGSPTQ